MKVLIAVCFAAQLLVVHSITVPPFWPTETPHYSSSVKVQRASSPYSPSDGHPGSSQTPWKPVNLQYRPSNNRKVLITHPVENRGTEVFTPQSYQIVHFDNPLQETLLRSKNIRPQPVYHPQPIYQQQKPIRQHLTEVTPQTGGRPPKYFKQNNLRPKKQESVEDDSSEEYSAPISEHEIPREIPTKPIYPGEGQWAKFGMKHQPYINNQKQRQPHTIHESGEEKIPAGYDTFEGGQEEFRLAQQNFHHDFETFPQRQQLKPSKLNNNDAEDSEPLYEKPEIGFVPQKLYTQVRRTEAAEHLPRSAVDPEEEENAGRLREVIKDSKIHTVYIEEGYEDSAYDHAGHEKKAENSEGHAEHRESEAGSAGKNKGSAKSRYSDEGGRHRGKSSLRKRLRNDERSEDENYDESETYKDRRAERKRKNHDTEVAGSDYESMKVNITAEQLPIKNITKVTLKNGNQEVIDMEIYTEVKFTPGPQKKKHKYVKIIPSTNKSTDIRNNDVTERIAYQKQLRRVKRYDKIELSKRYIRKRPNYYWKKAKTSTTERNLVNMRRKFETAFKTNHGKQPFRTTVQDTSHLLDEQRNESPKVNIQPTVPLTTTSTTTSATTSTTAATVSTTSAPPKLVDELREENVHPEATTKTSSKSSKSKVLPVKIRKFARKRQRRYTIDHPNINVDLEEFVDVEKLPKATPKPDLTHIKYPYYNLPVTYSLNENSPLRYAENLKNVPQKIENEMSFYKSRSHIVCPEVESDVDPIPDRVKNEEEGEDSDKMGESPDLPRLRGLGDKIDCLKEKYFGENPLDSPFFKEDVIEVPVPFFMPKKGELKKLKNEDISKIREAIKQLSSKTTRYSKTRKFANNNAAEKELPENTEQLNSRKSRKRELKIKILEPIVVLDDGLYETVTTNPIHRNAEAVLKPPYTLTEMMNMSQEKVIKLAPKSIYDQLTLLDQEDGQVTLKLAQDAPPEDKFIILYDSHEVNMNTDNSHPLEQTIRMIKPAVNGYTHPKVSDVLTNLTMLSYGMPQPDVINIIPENITAKELIQPSTTDIPQPQTEKSQIKGKKPENMIRKLTTKTDLAPQPKTTAIPEVAQLIQTSTFSPPSTKQILYQEPIIKHKPVVSIENLNVYQPSRLSAFYNIFDISRYLPRVTNHRIITSEVQYKDEIKPSQQMRMYSDVLKTISESKEDINQESAEDTVSVTVKSPVPSPTTPPSKEETTTSLEEGHENVSTLNSAVQQSSENVIGLVPPPNGLSFQSVYNNLINPLLPQIQIVPLNTNINKYFVVGMKPPEQNYHRISKRDTSKKFSAKSKSENMDDLLMEESEIFENRVPYRNSHRRNRRDVVKRAQQEKDYLSDDLIMEATQNRPVYQVTPPRKPKVYTEIVRTRQPQPQNEEENEEEEEDLNPRKRIYELRSNKPTSTEAPNIEEEIIVEEVPEITEPPTTPEPVIYSVEANSENPDIAQYIYFIGKLHDKWAKEEPPTTTTELKAEEATVVPSTETQTVAETINVPKGQPAYLQIINHLHDLRKEEEEKNPLTTTEPPEVIEEVQTLPVKNSNPYILDSVMPKSFMSELNLMQAKLDPDKSSSDDESSRIRNFSAKFKTSIDTSKYKTIERSPVSVRHNFSSRFNADDQELPLTRTQTTQRPTIFAIITKAQDAEESANQTPSVRVLEDVADTITEESSHRDEPVHTTTIKVRQRSRSRGRSTTTSTTERPTAVTTNPIFRRRRPARFSTTTIDPPSTRSDSLINRRRNRVRLSGSVETSTEYRTESPVAASTVAPEVIIVTPSQPEDKKQRRFQKLQERHFMTEVTVTRFFEPGSDESGDTSGEPKKHQYEVIGPLKHTDTGHGGNYKHEKDQPPAESTEEEVIAPINRPSDVTSSTDSFFSDPDLAANVNQLKDSEDKTTTPTITTTEKSQVSNVLLSKEEIAEKVVKKPTHSKVNLYPNMARMVNRLAEISIDTTTEVSQDEHDEAEQSNTEYKPTFIKDPSRRMYFYAKL